MRQSHDRTAEPLSSAGSGPARDPGPMPGRERRRALPACRSGHDRRHDPQPRARGRTRASRVAAISLATVVLALLAALPGRSLADPGDAAAVRERRADALLAAFVDGRDEDAGRHFDERMREGLPPAKLAEVRAALAAQLGAATGRGPARHGCVEGMATIWQQVEFERGILDARIGFAADGRIAGFFLVPPQQALPCPGQAAQGGTSLPEGVRERALTVDAGGWPLPGRLTLPAGEGPFPVAVLVHGSGPNDADQNVFARAPFRDLAHGLASRGIASLRYDKRSRVHPARLQAEHPDLTVAEEVVDDAVAALALLADQPDIDGGRRVVLGHSLGALLAPRIAARAGATGAHPAGVAMLAVPGRPLHRIVIDQVEYLAPHQGITEAALASLRVQADRLDALAAGAAPGDGPQLLDLPASWWRDLLAYDAIATARGLDLPLFLGHGGRDYQVTGEDLAIWRSGLAGLDRVTVREWPALDHLLGAGEGPSLPADYQRPAPVAEAVLDDLAAWIATLPDGD